MQKIKHNGFVYSGSEVKGELIVNLKLPDIRIPEVLYKYYPLNENSGNSISNKTLYASHPYQLNDIMDTSEYLIQFHKKPSFERYQNLFQDTLPMEKLVTLYSEDVDGRLYMQFLYPLLTDKLGIISLSGEESNDLMWPHYTGETGFQVGFETQKLKKSIEQNIGNGNQLFPIMPINYSEQVLQVKMEDSEDLIPSLFYSLNVKSKKWKYENEYRLVITKGNLGVPMDVYGFEERTYNFNPKNRCINYNELAISEITLGRNFFNRKNFKIEATDNEKIKTVQINKGHNFKALNNILNTINSLNNVPIFLCAIGGESINNDISLIRVKKRIFISKIKQNKFKITQTNINKKPNSI